MKTTYKSLLTENIWHYPSQTIGTVGDIVGYGKNHILGLIPGETGRNARYKLNHPQYTRDTRNDTYIPYETLIKHVNDDILNQSRTNQEPNTDIDTSIINPSTNQSKNSDNSTYSNFKTSKTLNDLKTNLSKYITPQNLKIAGSVAGLAGLGYAGYKLLKNKKNNPQIQEYKNIIKKLQIEKQNCKKSPNPSNCFSIFDQKINEIYQKISTMYY